ncbi:hypothetical protein KEJ25_02490, partial [Candidatus Bathyarchaeota archaeon]|nr:hypothetical protein [Candidatus Bathyarchaeota archaeon]
SCRNEYLGKISRGRSLEERRKIALRGASALKERGVYQSEDYRRKRSEIAKRLLKKGKIRLSSMAKLYPEGYWKDRKLSLEHRIAIGRGVRERFERDRSIRERISHNVKISLTKSEKYRKLVESGFFKRVSYKAWRRSAEAWRKRGFRSRLEEDMAKYLREWGIPYRREYIYVRRNGNRGFATSIDFVIGDKVALLMNGCWWHVCPVCGLTPKYERQKANMVKDQLLLEELEKRNFKTVIVWEHELRNTQLLEDVRNRIYEAVGISGHGIPKIKHVKVKNVKHAGRYKVLNISTRKNKNFFLANGILTHNTSDAQHALRRTMEKYTDTCRFILSCNYSSRIIEPIQSRCAIFRFAPLPRVDTVDFLKRIAKSEDVPFSEDGVDAIAEIAAGDLRRAINLLQAASATGESVTSDVVYRVIGLVHPKRISDLLDISIKGDLIEAREELRKMLYMEGYSGSDIVKQIHSQVFKLDVPEPVKLKIIELVGEADFRIDQGADEEVQIMALLAKIKLAALKGG